MKLLWLDDYRDPYINDEGRVPPQFNSEDIIWVRDYDEFTDWIIKNGLPDAISFDHDLAPEHYTPPEYWDDYLASKTYQESKTYEIPNGFDCAWWLTQYCWLKKLDLPLWYVHSANPVGADKIKDCLNRYVENEGHVIKEYNEEKDKVNN